MKSKTPNKQKQKVDFTIDMTSCVTVNDLIAEIAYSKLDNKININSEEVCAIIKDVVEDAVNEAILDMFDGHNAVIVEAGKYIPADAVKVVKKQNIFKRFWNWITRK